MNDQFLQSAAIQAAYSAGQKGEPIPPIFAASPIPPAPGMIYDPATDPTRGQNPTFAKAAPLPLRSGRVLQARRLGIEDIPNMVELINKVMVDGHEKAVKDFSMMLVTLLNSRSSIEMVFMAIAPLIGTVSHKKAVIDYLANIFGLTEEEIRNPDIVPADSIIDMLESLRIHPEVIAFFNKSERAKTLFAPVLALAPAEPMQTKNPEPQTEPAPEAPAEPATPETTEELGPM